MGKETRDYPLGYSAQEAQRLEDQAARLQDLTEDVLRRAGLRPGMRVLDLGSGAGDVSLLAAKIVGNDGIVLGIEKASSSVEIARRRVAALGVQNVGFEHSGLAEFATDRTFDAIIGRFVLSYVPERAAVLRKLTRHLAAGGIIAVLEIDLPRYPRCPPPNSSCRHGAGCLRPSPPAVPNWRWAPASLPPSGRPACRRRI